MRPYVGVLVIALSLAFATWLWIAELESESRCVARTTSRCFETVSVDVVADWQRPVAVFVAIAGSGVGALLLRGSFGRE